MAALVRSALMFLAWLSSVAIAAPLTAEQVPDELKPWMPWVLRGHESLECPLTFNQAQQRRCSWPSQLSLDLDGRGGRFELMVRTYAPGWTLLPGDATHWPQDVSLAGRSLVVTAAGGEPRVWLEPGAHRIAGVFRWDRLPETLTIPSETGLVGVTVDGRELPFPGFKEQGQLWLRLATAPAERTEAENRLDLEIFRWIIDERPLRIVTRIVLRAAGVARETVLQGAALPGSIPLALDSPLPARVEADGTLRLQLKPGTWVVDVTTRFPGDVFRLQLPAVAAPWPQEEIWSFEPRSHLRMVQIEGPLAIDPRQTNVPEEWQGLPAYRMQASEALDFRVQRRGDPDPAPDRLQLDRDLWLDFDGRGYTATDAISGMMTRNWRLDARPELRLGRVSLDGAPQSITRLADGSPQGVEVRRGALQLSADSRFEGLRSRLPATGWAQDFQQVRTRLHLPPGWRLIAATGVDNAPDTWLGRWTLLDLFVVLIGSLAAGRLWSWRAGAMMLAGLALLWHEAEAPRFIWLNLLATIALLRVVPPGRLARGLGLYRNLSFALLLLISIPFAYDQVRWGLYPQLEQPWRQPGTEPSERVAAMPAQVAAEAAGEEAAAPAEALSDYAARAAKRYAGPPPASSPPTPRDDVDPHAITQTGPGVPTWQWRSVDFSWNGPVLAGQGVGLMLLSPAMNLVLNLCRVGFLVALGALLAGLRPGSGKGGVLPCIALLCGFVPGVRADFPPPELLEQLSRRLLEAPDCLPSCAQIAHLRLDIRDDSLTQILEIHAQHRVSLPVPGQVGEWVPERATLDGADFDALVREPDGSLSVAVEAGRHQLTLTGRLPPREQVQLTLPLTPRNVEVRSSGWTVEGVREDGIPDTQLRLRRMDRTTAETGDALVARPLAPFVEVTRTLRIGLDWRVDTSVRRWSPSDQPISLEIPLLDGEAVTSGDLRVRDGRVAVNLAPGTDQLGWTSIWGPREEFTLRAPAGDTWVETWRLDLSPIWHAEASGIAVVHHQDAAGNWMPEWQPWAGEQVTLHFARPIGAEGNTLTIDDSRVELRPGRRAMDGTLVLTLRSTQGTQHRVQLPEGAALLSATIDGATQPLRQQQSSVTLPVHPGRQEVALHWRIDRGPGSRLRTPAVDLGAPGVNHRIDVELGQDRWLLLVGGPRWGPAVLFWGLLVVVALLALGLGRIRWTPLGTRGWVLLLIGLSQVPIAAGFTVVVWLLALGRRATLDPALGDRRFNAMQAGLAALTLAALLILVGAVHQGLLGYPDMQIAGNGSTATSLHWYQDRTGPVPPRAWLVSVPLWAYRLAMLAWALWLALALLGWLRWGWACYAAGGLWRRSEPDATPVADKTQGDPWLEGKPPSP